MKQIQISIVVPLFNEEAVFPLLMERLDAVMNSSELGIEVVLVNDGSLDTTAELMKQKSLEDIRYQSLFLSRNYGHEYAVSAGLSSARGTEAVMVMDGDLQDPPEMLFEFYKWFTQGYDVIYAIRKSRKEHFIKNFAYKLFYRLQSRMSRISIPMDSGDFSLMSRKVVDAINSFPEESRYIRGLRAWVGFRQKGIAYERSKRAAGATKYPLNTLLKLAYNGIFNFSELPIKSITRLGAVIVCIAVCYLMYTLVMKFLFGTVPKGFTALLMTIILFSGVQLLSLGIIGEYVVRIFFQVKNRPLFIISHRIENGEVKSG